MSNDDFINGIFVAIITTLIIAIVYIFIVSIDKHRQCMSALECRCSLSSRLLNVGQIYECTEYFENGK